MDSSFFNSFENIDLGEVHNKDDDEIGDPRVEVTKTEAKIVNKCEPLTSNKQDKSYETVINPELDSICKKMMLDYSKYFSLDMSSQASELDECIENLLTHMEEFYGLVESIRADNTKCVDHILDTFSAKWELCQQLFAKIDKLEATVKRASNQVNEMEVEIFKAEEMMGKKNSASTVKKIFGFINLGLRS